ncbi:redox-regulated ATPase YchF [Candidatus Woesearchaeota archaeon]|nr:redox-regulated ATPase YchF [Candidatus Woesearchaeota archaeon]
MFIALFGKPSVGKSSFFKAATLAEAEIANYPFTTLKSQEGIAYVKVKCIEGEFKVKCTPRFGYCINENRFVPIKLTDIPGLIEGSHIGAGRGNEFLTSIASADALIHIIDISGSTNEKGESVKPLSHDPLKDVRFLEHELDMWYFGIMKKGWEKFARTVQQENQNIKKALAKQLSSLKVAEENVEESIKKLKLIHHPTEWSNDDLKSLASELRRVTKPIIIAANKIDINGSKLNLDRLKESFPEYTIIPSSADSELALREAAKHELIEYIPGENSFKIISDKLTKEQKNALEYIQKNVLDIYGSTGVQDILDFAVFDLLKYLAIFPGGLNNLKDSEGRTIPDCYLMPDGSSALDFAFRLHTDLGNNFIKAYDVRAKRVIGKEYLLKNRDIIEIVVKR